MTATPDRIQIGDHAYPVAFVAAHWINMQEPLSDRLQDVAHALVQSGRLPEFEEYFQ